MRECIDLSLETDFSFLRASRSLDNSSSSIHSLLTLRDPAALVHSAYICAPDTLMNTSQRFDGNIDCYGSQKTVMIYCYLKQGERMYDSIKRNMYNYVCMYVCMCTYDFIKLNVKK